MDVDFAISRPLVRPRMPRIRFLFVRSRLCSTLPPDPASRRRPCAFASTSPPSGCAEDFHLQAARHAWHTTLPASGRHTLNHDAGRYRDQVESTPISFTERRREVLAWLPRFGHLRTPKPHWVDRRHIAAALAEIPAGSVTRVRLDLMHWTGMRPSQMGRLRAEDFRLDEPIPYVAVPRGKGGRIAAVPLVREGVAAARAFLDAEAFGPWPRSSVNRALAAAARRAGRPVFTTYQIRHSFAAGLQPPGPTWRTSSTLYVEPLAKSVFGRVCA